MKTMQTHSFEKKCIQLDSDWFEARCATYYSENGLHEYHITLQPKQPKGDFDAQLAELKVAYDAALQSLNLEADTAVIRRFFCSDPANQQSAIEAHPLADVEAPCAVSIIGQPPMPGGKIALWAYHVSETEKATPTRRTGNQLELQRGELTHYWSTSTCDSESSDSASQTDTIFCHFDKELADNGMQLSENVVRTWLYVRDVDSNYQGLVDARREYFHKHGLCPDTHYIASTGIEGRTADAAAKVSMDAYSIAGLRPEQVSYLHAADYLGPTHLYGVSFERATAVAFADRKHIYVSGTASINPAGEVLHIGDVSAQLERALLNIEALLQDADADLDDVAQLIVYLRDTADAESMRKKLNERFPSTPLILTWAPVCRPTWLIEIEAIAIKANSDNSLPAY